MIIPKEESLKDIRTQFNIIENDIKNQMSLFDDGITHIAELFIEELLNIVFREKGYCFKNLNYKRINHPAVDLGDEDNQISWQVTVTNPTNINEKIKHTLESFFRHGLEKNFRELNFFVLSGKPDNIRILESITFDSKELQVKPELFNENNVWDFKTLYKYIEHLSTTSLEEILTVVKKIPRRPQKPNYIFFEKHILRTFTDINSKECNPIQLIEEKKQLVLMGFGGMGKSTEVDFIAASFAKHDGWICFKISLIDYATTLKDLLNANCKNWYNHAATQRILFLLDGLDEVGPELMAGVFKECKQLLKEFDDINILVTCRNNFFHFASADHKTHEDFKLLYIEEITVADIYNHINTVCKQPEEFKQSMSNGKFLEILRNPFFLTNTIELFNLDGYIPNNKTDFFERLIQLRKSTENKKTDAIHRIIHRYNLEIDISIKKLAFVFQFAGKYQVSDNDLCRIVDNYDVRIALQRILLKEMNFSWRFEHNNFQEYLAAKTLSELTWDTVEGIITIPRYKKLRPRWLNSFSFLLNILSTDSILFKDVIKWALENDIETLVKIETDKIDIETRVHVFKEIFNSYKAKEMIIWRSAFTIEELARFGGLENNNSDLIEYLLDEVDKSDASPESASNAIYLMFYVNDITKFKGLIFEKYLPLLDCRNEKFGTLSRIFESFSKWMFFDKEIISTIIDKDLISNANYARSEMCNYIVENRYENLYAGYLFKCYKSISEEKSKLYYDKNNFAKLISLLPINEFEHFLTLLKGIDYRHEHDEHETLFKSLVDISIDKYPLKPTIKERIIELMYRLRDCYRTPELLAFEPFFERTGLALESFKELIISDELLKDRSYLEYEVPCSFINEECLNWLIDEYNAHKLPDNNVWQILFVLGKYKSEYRDKFYKKINAISENKFIYQPSQWQIFEDEKNKLKFEALLSRDKFIEYIEVAFKIAGKDELTKEEVIKLENQEHKELDVLHNLCFVLLRDLREKIYKKATIIKHFEKQENWDWYLIYKYHTIIGYKELPEPNKNWLLNWLYKINPDTLKFTIEETRKGETYTITYNPIALYYSVYSMYLGIIPSKDILLNMTNAMGVFNLTTRINSTAKEYSLGVFIFENLEKEELSDKLMKNLTEGIQSRIVLLETILLIEKLNLLIAIKLLIPYIENTKIDKYYRLKILECYIKLGGDAGLLMPTLNTLSVNDTFDYKVIEYLILKEVPSTSDFLIQKMNEGVGDKLKVGYYLLKCNQLCGFELIIEILTTSKKSIDRGYAPENDYFQAISIKNIDNQSLISYLLKMLEIYLQKDFVKHEFDDSVTKIFIILCDVLLNNKPDWAINIIQEVENLLNTTDKNTNYKNIQYQFSDFKEKIKIQIDREKEIDKALEEVRQLDLVF